MALKLKRQQDSPAYDLDGGSSVELECVTCPWPGVNLETESGGSPRSETEHVQSAAHSCIRAIRTTGPSAIRTTGASLGSCSCTD